MIRVLLFRCCVISLLCSGCFYVSCCCPIVVWCYCVRGFRSVKVLVLYWVVMCWWCHVFWCFMVAVFDCVMVDLLVCRPVTC